MMKHRSPFAQLAPISRNEFEIDDAFWAPRLSALRVVTLPGQYQSMESTGRIDNFRRAAGIVRKDHEGYVFNDSDVYKWLEAAAHAGKHEAYDAAVTEIVNLALAAQQPDGYLNTAFMFEKAGDRWANIRDNHELYSAGHFIEAALALHEAGDDRLFGAAQQLADLVCRLFGPEELGKRPVVPGHEEIEIALIALYRATGKTQYLEQAQFFVHGRGKKWIGGQAYHQDHLPFVRLQQMTGHAVRAVYLNIAAADLFLETGETSLRDTLERLWERMYAAQVYVTGGLGARRSGEAFGDPYELPNEKAYSETCAAVASIFWNSRMLQMTADARYADAIENALFNAALSGISLAGDRYFYTNPLASDGTHQRSAYFSCACCPPNIARLLARLPELLSSVSENAVWIHQYAAGKAGIQLDGKTIRLDVDTVYPKNGAVRITVHSAGNYHLNLRVPAWAGEARVNINDAPAQTFHAGYACLRRDWQVGDQVRMELPMAPVWLTSHHAVTENSGRVALSRGPLIYCFEMKTPHPDSIFVDPEKAVDVIDCGGWNDLKIHAVASNQVFAEQDALYKPHQVLRGEPVELRAIPYFSWANKAPAPMRVWVKESGPYA